MRIALMLLWQPVLLRRTMGTPWAQWLLLALTAGFTVWAMLDQPKPAAGLACIVGVGQLVLWWALFIISIGLQHAPRGARLVPKLRRIALATTVFVWLCLVLIIVLAAGGVFGHHALWAPVAGLSLAGVALLMGGRWECPLFLAPGLLLTGFYDVAQIAALLATPAGMAGSAALVCASMFYTLRQVLGRPDGEKPDGKFLHLWSHMVCGTQLRQEALKGPVAVVYASCLRRDCARRDIQNLLLHALGPYLHWSRLHFGLLPTLLINIGFAVVIRQQLFPSLNAGALAGMLVGSVVSSQLVLQQGVACVAAGQPEHALLRLAPGMPGPNALNRMLARGLLGLFFTNWLVAMSYAALLLAVADVPQEKFIEYMSSLSASALLAAGMLRNFALANKTRARIAMGLLYGLTFGLMFLVMPFLGSLLPGLPASRSAVLAALLVMLLAWLIVWCCWRTLLSAPPAFPAARI